VSGGPYTTIATVRGTGYIDANLVGSTTYYYVVKALNGAGQSTNSTPASATPTANLPSPWVAQDLGFAGVVGSNGKAGSESFSNGVFTVAGSGNDIWDTADGCRFVYETNSGNCTVIARIASVVVPTNVTIDVWSKAGVMIRASLASNAPNAFIGVTPSNGVTFQYRSTANGNSANAATTGLSAPYWVKLVRSGNTFTGYRSPDGTNWTQQGSATTIAMGTTVYVGLAVTAHNSSGMATATFDNVTAPGWPPPLPSVPTGLVAASGMEHATLNWLASSNATSYNVKRSTTNGGPYTIVANATTTNCTDGGLTGGTTYYYVVSAANAGGESADSDQASATPTTASKLTGTIIGTADSWGGSGNTIAKVFDNNLTTFFDAPDPGNGDWVGLDFGMGVSNIITRINYCPRSGSESRMVGGIFQGANQADFSDAVTLFIITTQPATGVFTSASITNPAGFRYVRYLSPNGGYGNVAELEFYGYLWSPSGPVPPAPTGLVATAAFNGQVSLTWNSVTNAASYNVKRSTTNGGPYTLASNVTMTNYTDAGLTNGTTYYYVVSALNTAGESTNSIQASVTAQTLVPTGLSATAISTSQMNLVWNGSTNASSYNVKRSTTNGGPYSIIAPGLTTTNCQDSGLDGGTMYYYVVSATVSGSETTNSAQASAATLSPTLGSLVHRYSFSESGGATVADSVGGPVWTGILPNGGTLAGGQLALSGSLQYASLPAGVVSSLTNVTVMAWVNLATVNYWSRIFDFGNDTTSYLYVTPRNGFDYTARLAISTSGAGGEQKINCNQAVDPGAWHQVGVSLSAGTGILYVDGVAVGTNSRMSLNPSSLGSTTHNYLGRSQSGTDPYLDGALDEFRIYNVGLSAAEIAATAALGSSQQLSTNSPAMSIASSGASLTMSWPLGCAGYTLQSRTNLTAGNWVDVTIPAPQIVSNQWQLALPAATNAGPAFYRLMK